MRLHLRRLLKISLVLTLLAVGFLLATNAWMLRHSSHSIYSDIAALPQNDVALVLGSSRTVGGRWKNPFFEGRMNTAARLFKDGKVRHLLVSGDNSRVGYDEPTWMRDALIERGVPESAITLDYAGFRTLDSMARAKAVFGLQKFTIVTDGFHQPRAVFLAKTMGLDAVGFTSEQVPSRFSKKTRLREYAARTGAWLDVYVLHTKPKFYGPPVEIRVAAAE